MQAICALDITDGPGAVLPRRTLKYDEKGRRVGAKICIVQWQNGAPVAVHPDSIAASTGELAEDVADADP